MINLSAARKMIATSDPIRWRWQNGEWYGWTGADDWQKMAGYSYLAQLCRGLAITGKDDKFRSARIETDGTITDAFYSSWGLAKDACARHHETGSWD